MDKIGNENTTKLGVEKQGICKTGGCGTPVKTTHKSRKGILGKGKGNINHRTQKMTN